MKAFLKTALLLTLCALSSNIEAVEIKYAFKKGNTYTYQYSQQNNAKATASTVNSSRNQAVPAVDFTIKVIDYQDGAFILDIGNKDATFRRYLKENGEIKGAPAETGQAVPFFLTFPTGDWKVSEKRQIRKDLIVGDKTIPAVWNLLLKSVDNEKGTAEILFTAGLQLPDDRLRQKSFSLKGRAVFNLFEGVVHQAEWQTLYKFSFANKEFAVTRNLWDFEKQTTHSLSMTGIQE